MGDAESLLTTNGVPEAASEAPETAKKISDIVPGGICETKLLEERYENGELKKMEKTPNTVKPEMQHESYALVSTQSFDKYHKPDKTSLEINSPQLLRALKEVIKYYPGQPLIFESQAKIESPFAILYHHMQELEEYRTSATDEIAKKHVKLLLDYLDSGTGAEARKLASRGFTTFPLLWSIFKPGELLFKIENGHKRLYWLEKSAYEKGYFQGEYFQLNCLYTTYDGTQDGKAREDLKIYQQAECPSTNALEIIALSVIPLKYHPDPEGVKIEMSERGKRHEKLQGLHVMLYDGIFMCLKMPPYTHYGNAGSFEGVWLPHTATGRVVVDGKTFEEDNKAHKVKVYPWAFSEGKVVNGPQDTLVLCPPYVYGYFLEIRCWCQFFVDQLSTVLWNPDAFNTLLLPPNHKRLIRSLVGAHRFPTQARDESVLKGRGLVALLHGPPGTGKTLTAEAVAEHTKKPLLIIPTGELGSQLDAIQTEIKKLIRYAMMWKAIVLIDEADVFLEARQNGGAISLEKNGLVAVFLRQLEYFQGIIFLTSNRAQIFDPAVKSRIHLTLQYSTPNISTRRQLWHQKLQLIPLRDVALDLEKTLDVVAKYEMNGREILNAVNFAKTIAKDELRELKLEHLEMVLKVWADSKIIEEREVKGDEIVVKLVMPSRIRAWAVVVLGAAVLLSLLLGPLRTTEFE